MLGEAESKGGSGFPEGGAQPPFLEGSPGWWSECEVTTRRQALLLEKLTGAENKTVGFKQDFQVHRIKCWRPKKTVSSFVVLLVFLFLFWGIWGFSFFFCLLESDVTLFWS